MFQTNVVEIKHTFYVQYFSFLENNVEKYCRGGQTTDENVIRRMRIACLIPKPTNTPSQYIVLTAFPLQQWLHESPSVSHYTHTVCLVRNSRNYRTGFKHYMFSHNRQGIIRGLEL